MTLLSAIEKIQCFNHGGSFRFGVNIVSFVVLAPLNSSLAQGVIIDNSGTSMVSACLNTAIAGRNVQRSETVYVKFTCTGESARSIFSDLRRVRSSSVSDDRNGRFEIVYFNDDLKHFCWRQTEDAHRNGVSRYGCNVFVNIGVLSRN